MRGALAGGSRGTALSGLALMQRCLNCPIVAAHGRRAVRSGAKGRLRLQYVLRDKGPRQQVPAHWVPQLQLHLLATGCHSVLLLSRRAQPACSCPWPARPASRPPALLSCLLQTAILTAPRPARARLALLTSTALDHHACRSATRGSRIFRLMRDQGYLLGLLGTLSSMHCGHVLRRRPPPTNMFSRDPRYRALLGATARLGRQAAVVMEVPGGGDGGEGEGEGEGEDGEGPGGDAFLE